MDTGEGSRLAWPFAFDKTKVRGSLVLSNAISKYLQQEALENRAPACYLG
jgi:hypothetical protein